MHESLTMEALIELDKALFTLINGHWHIPLADQVLPYWREKTTWIPLYLLLTIWLVRRFRWQALWILLGAGLVITCADQLSSSVIKPAVDRLRPCAEPGLDVRLLLESCGGRSFTSSHATNHFAIFVFFAAFFRKHIRFIVPVGFFWAASISYAQVYVGVHYPADVLAGGILGCLIGWLIHRFVLTLDARFNSRRLSVLLS